MKPAEDEEAGNKIEARAIRVIDEDSVAHLPKPNGSQITRVLGEHIGHLRELIAGMRRARCSQEAIYAKQWQLRCFEQIWQVWLVVESNRDAFAGWWQRYGIVKVKR